MANKIGGAGFQLAICTQTSADLEARLGSRAKAEQVVGNLNTIVMFRVRNVAAAEQLTQGTPRSRPSWSCCSPMLLSSTCSPVPA